MTTKTYNGWTNYETWNVKLWLDNEESTYHYWTGRTRQIWDDSDTPDNAKYELSEALKDEITDEVPEITGMFADLIGAALGEVNWYEIAESYLDGITDDY